MQVELWQMTDELIAESAKEVLFNTSFGVPVALVGTPKQLAIMFHAMSERLEVADTTLKEEGYKPSTFTFRLHQVL